MGLEKISIEVESKPGKIPVVIWVPEGTNSDNRVKVYSRAAKVEARIINWSKGNLEGPLVECSPLEYWLDFAKEVPKLLLWGARGLYELINTDKPKEWAKAINYGASQVM